MGLVHSFLFSRTAETIYRNTEFQSGRNQKEILRFQATNGLRKHTFWEFVFFLRPCFAKSPEIDPGIILTFGLTVFHIVILSRENRDLFTPLCFTPKSHPIMLGVGSGWLMPQNVM